MPTQPGRTIPPPTSPSAPRPALSSILRVLTTLALEVQAGSAFATRAESPAGWQPDGIPIVARDGQQLLISIHPDGSGGAFILWRDDLPPDPRTYIYASHVTSAGTLATGWPAEGIPIF